LNAFEHGFGAGQMLLGGRAEKALRIEGNKQIAMVRR